MSISLVDFIRRSRAEARLRQQAERLSLPEESKEPEPKPEPRVYKSKEQRRHEKITCIHPHGYIYKIINTLDNLVYIGSTTSDLKTRFNQHVALSWSPWNNQSICKHILQLNAVNFTIIELGHFENITLRQLHIEEDKHIDAAGTLIYGLNVVHATENCVHGFLRDKCSTCKIKYECAHNRPRRNCIHCKYIDPMSVNCIHIRTKSCCHVCNNCAHCNVLCTPEHQALPSHIQRVIKAAQAAEHTANVAQIIKQAVHRPELFQLE